jgi:hypothetical protein
MKSRTSKSLFGVSLFIFILFLAGTVYAASNVLNVKCVDESGKALAGTKVLIMPLGKDGKWQDKTADNTGVASSTSSTTAYTGLWHARKAWLPGSMSLSFSGIIPRNR